jgi:peptidase E
MSGRIIVNGNARAEADLIFDTRKAILNPRHQDPQVQAERTTVLVTAAWQGNEHREGHIKKALYEIGIEPLQQDGYDRRVVNLSVYHALLEFNKREPKLAALYSERDELIRRTRTVYLEKNAFYTAQMRRAFEHLRQFQPDRRLSQVLASSPTQGHRIPGRFRGRELLMDFLSEDLADTVDRLVENDNRLTRLITDLDQQFREGVGLAYHDSWQQLRQGLEATLLSAGTVLIFGGNLETLHRCLNFFDLRGAFVEALRRGTTFVTVSAGSLLLCERIIIYDDFAQGKEFHLFDRGFGLVRSLQIFPHCDDRIQVDDQDNLAYLAHRFGEKRCVGLNEGSYLLLEQDDEHKAVSFGTQDGVYVFDRSGQKRRYDHGEALLL